MRQVIVRLDPAIRRQAYQLVQFADLAVSWLPELNYMIPVEDERAAKKVEGLRDRGLSNVFWVEGQSLETGDVLIPEPLNSRVTVSYRQSDLHHSLFLTNRCNSNCLMCSQPPTKHDDGWLVDEALDIIRHISVSPSTLGLSGGEPLLLGVRLREILEAVQSQHPTTRIDVLTNGRLLSDSRVATEVLTGLSARVQWLVPLYGHTDLLHDFVVQAPGAFEQTIEGILVLQEHSQPIQLRIVLVEPVLEYLEGLCGFVGRNLPFVHEVALIACEPIGFALANRELCEVDLVEWHDMLRASSRALRRYGVRHIFMNSPLCALPQDLWPFAHRSISDWKQVYADECDRCLVKDRCSGLFAWHERGWKPAKIVPFEESLA